MAFGIDDAIGAGLSIINKFIPDPAQKAQAEASLRDSLQKWDASQASVDAEEAQSSSLFIAGWRPFIGWIGGLALGYKYVFGPLALWGAAVFGYHLPPLPTFDNGLYELVFALLGLGGMRTYEKIKGVANSH